MYLKHLNNQIGKKGSWNGGKSTLFSNQLILGLGNIESDCKDLPRELLNQKHGTLNVEITSVLIRLRFEESVMIFYND